MKQMVQNAQMQPPIQSQHNKGQRQSRKGRKLIPTGVTFAPGSPGCSSTLPTLMIKLGLGLIAPTYPQIKSLIFWNCVKLWRELLIYRIHILWSLITICHPDSKVLGANMEPIWGRQDPGGPHVGPMNFAIWAMFSKTHPTPACLVQKWDVFLWIKSTAYALLLRLSHCMQYCVGNVVYYSDVTYALLIRLATWQFCLFFVFLHANPIARFMGQIWGRSGANRTQVGAVLAPYAWTLLSGI